MTTWTELHPFKMALICFAITSLFAIFLNANKWFVYSQSLSFWIPVCFVISFGIPSVDYIFTKKERLINGHR